MNAEPGANRRGVPACRWRGRNVRWRPAPQWTELRRRRAPREPPARDRRRDRHPSCRRLRKALASPLPAVPDRARARRPRANSASRSAAATS